MKNTKRYLRKEILRKIGSFSIEYIEKSDSVICSNILKSDLYRDAKSVFLFAPMNREINTFPIIEKALKDNKIVCIPKCTSPLHMIALKINDIGQITKNSKGIPEPEDGCDSMDREKIDLTIVPCLTADKRGYRLGYGGGYYDNFLSSYYGTSIVVCRKKQMSLHVPVEEHDIPADFIATEGGLRPKDH